MNKETPRLFAFQNRDEKWLWSRSPNNFFTYAALKDQRPPSIWVVTLKTSTAYSLATTYNLHDIIREGRGALSGLECARGSHTTF